MGLFRKRDKSVEGIAAFWQWWSQTRDEVAAAIKNGTVGELADAFGARVSAIHPGLDWELTPGGEAAHALVVTAAGKAEQRATAHRWLAQAPAADAVWEYRCSRIADPPVLTSTLRMGPVELEMDRLGYAISVDRQRREIDVVCHHPAFAQLPDEARAQVTFLSLDWLLGEDSVEIWLGAIEWTADPPQDLKSPHDLKHAVHAIAEDDQWALMGGEDREGMPMMATISVPLRPARWPRFDMHVAVTLAYQRFNDGQLPMDGSLEALRAFEDRLSETLRGDGALVAHETHRKRRTLHFYVDSQSDAAARIESAAGAWAEGRANVEAKLDPGFGRLAHLTGR